MLILVRHAMPEIEPETDPAIWSLSKEGREAAQRLTMPAGALLVASREPKAIETLAPHGDVMVDEAFGEVRRVEAFGGAFRQRRMAYVGGVDHADWEPRHVVSRRFSEAVDRARARAAGRPVVIGTHGMAMTVWLTSTGRVEDPVAFWEGLGFPDQVTVEQGATTRGARTAD